MLNQASSGYSPGKKIVSTALLYGIIIELITTVNIIIIFNSIKYVKSEKPD